MSKVASSPGPHATAKRPQHGERAAKPLVFVLLASVAAWAILFAVFPPAAQDFPLNDDWAFARGVFLFARGQGVHYSGWASMPQLGQWLWSLPFLWTLGESHCTLRVGTVVLSWLGLWAFYDLLRREGLSPKASSIAAGTLAFNPLFFLLQGTFMTDVPALSLSLIALALYGRAFVAGRPALALGACAVAVLAVITRQNTLVIVPVAAVLLWRNPALRKQPGWLMAMALPGAAGVAAHFWFQGRPDVRRSAPSLPAPEILVLLPFLIVHCCGLAVLPQLVVGRWAVSWKRFAGVAALLLAGAGYWYAFGRLLPYGGLFPYSENMISPWGAFAGSSFTGPLVVGSRPLVLDVSARFLLTVVGCLAGAALACRAGEHGGTEWLRSPLLLFSALQLPFLLVAPDLYDRYLLFLLPGAIRLAAAEPARARLGFVPAAVALAGFGLVSLCLMHDWLAWNAARWELGRRALFRKLDPRDIEGGFEWDGWFAPVEEGAAPGRVPHRRVLPFTRNAFPKITGKYALAFSEPAGAVRLDAEPYRLWLAPDGHVFVLVGFPKAPGPVAPSPAPR